MTKQIETLGGRIAAERAALGVSQANLAAAIQVHPVTLWRWENDRNRPHYEYLTRIAGVLGVPVSALVPEDDDFFA